MCVKEVMGAVTVQKSYIRDITNQNIPIKVIIKVKKMQLNR